MKFYGEGKVSFADAGGVYLGVRFVNGEYETQDETEIKLLKASGYKCRKNSVNKQSSKEKDNGK